MKKLTLLVITLVLTLTAFSQTATDSTEPVRLSVLRSMIKDIVLGDACSAERDLLRANISILTARVRSKDSVITSQGLLADNLQKQVDNGKRLADLQNIKYVADEAKISDQDSTIKAKDKQISSTEKKIKWQKTKSTILILGVAAAAAKIFIFK